MRSSPPPPTAACRRWGARRLYFSGRLFFFSSENPAIRVSSHPSESDANGGTSCCLKRRGASGLVTIWQRRRSSCAGVCQQVSQPCVRTRPSIVPRCSCGESGLPAQWAPPRPAPPLPRFHPPGADQCQQPYGRRLVGITISAAGISLGRRTASPTPPLLYVFPPFPSLHFLLHFF